MDDSKKLSNNQSNHRLSWVLSTRQHCDFELLLNGGFYPLTRLLVEADYQSVLSEIQGLYAKARQGKFNHFIGIDDPYEVPEEHELALDTTNITIQSSLTLLIQKLAELGYCSFSVANLNKDDITTTQAPNQQQELAHV